MYYVPPPDLVPGTAQQLMLSARERAYYQNGVPAQAGNYSPGANSPIQTQAPDNRH